MVLNQFCQLSMELIKNYYELYLFEKKPQKPSAFWATFSFFKKVEGGGGWVEKLARHNPINPSNRLCIGC